ncbi:uncharacterized protein LOC119772128 [Cyprinodon tularosa]|uniref:uncharacterized protein LOC119772128 n=1 Tax=Cyprinodon tularosa TaxID=77115 RepID=UPI0018E24185|nr:uncharacterized protein LOC119772128 [Cyprinodon tularosa]
MELELCKGKKSKAEFQVASRGTGSKAEFQVAGRGNGAEADAPEAGHRTGVSEAAGALEEDATSASALIRVNLECNRPVAELAALTLCDLGTKFSGPSGTRPFRVFALGGRALVALICPSLTVFSETDHSISNFYCSPQSSIMMEKILLGFLFLLDCVVLSTCVIPQYYFVNQPLTWNEAQIYCRQKHTDLATILNSKELNQLINILTSAGHSSDVWIGLFSKIDWKWSDGYTGIGADYRNWREYQPSWHYSDDFCVGSYASGSWFDDNCTENRPFSCYTGSRSDPDYVYVNTPMNWFNAQIHCRENFIDLATIKDVTQDQQVQSLIADGDEPWIGLYRDPDHHWSDRRSVLFTNWDSGVVRLNLRTVVCGATSTGSSGRWKLLPCETRLPFVCYDSVVKQVVKLRFHFKHPVDMEDPVLKGKILTKLQNKLAENGVSGVTLKWRKQSDGRVFKKEKKEL